MSTRRATCFRTAAFLCGFLALASALANIASAQGGLTTGTTGQNFTNAGASGSTFTKIWVGARASGLAGAYSGLADDITSLYWNPAGIARLPGVNVSATHTLWFAGISHEFIGASIPISDRYRFGLALTLVDYGSLPYSTIQNDANSGTFNANDLSFALTFAGALTDRFSYGATVKYLRSAILDLAAEGLAFDAGSLYQTDFYHMRISMVLSNLGSDRNFTGNSLAVLINNGSGLNQNSTAISSELKTGTFPLPLVFRLGAATDVFQGNVENQKLNLDFDFSTHSDGPEQYNLGGEYVYNDMAAFRLGYAFNQDQLGLGAGAGYRYKTEDFAGTVDYSINLTKTLGSIHRISVSATFQ